MQYYGYHDMSSATYAGYCTSLANQGFRVISLCVHGDAGEPRYTAVWVKYSAGVWEGKHDIKAGDYQTLFDKYKAKGYTPMIVTAVGKLHNSVFAIIFEKGSFGNWKAKHDMSEADFNAENTSAYSSGLMLKSYTIYGTASQKIFAAIWHQNPGWYKSHLYPYKTLPDYQSLFNAETSLNLYRPSVVAISPDKQYGVHFTDNAVGQWVAKHNLNATEYQIMFNDYKNMGLMPICVDAIGTGNNALYTVIFAQTHIPEQKQWLVLGTGSPFLLKLDKLAEDFMRNNAVRAMQISVGKNGVNHFNKGYNFSESIYRKADENTRFLLASCSKMFVCAALDRLFATGALNATDKVYKILGGFSSPKDAKSDDITIQQLIDMQSGYKQADDCTYNMRAIGLKLSPKRTVVKKDVADYMYKNVALSYTPGALPAGETGYCNYNYVLLSMVIEKLSGQDYFTNLSNTILIPENIVQVKPWATNKTPRDADEILQEDQHLGKSAVNVTSIELVPSIYGGDGMAKEAAIGSCGLAASAFAMVQFIHQHAVWGNGPRVTLGRMGDTPGAATYAQSRADNIDWAYTINTREFKDSTLVNKEIKVLADLRQAINALLDTNGALL